VKGTIQPRLAVLAAKDPIPLTLFSSAASVSALPGRVRSFGAWTTFLIFKAAHTDPSPIRGTIIIGITRELIRMMSLLATNTTPYPAVEKSSVFQVRKSYSTPAWRFNMARW
jgi:hypothetical protein